MIYAVREHADKRISVVIRAADRVRLYLYGSWQAPSPPRGDRGDSVCVAGKPHGGYCESTRVSQRHQHRGAARLRTFEGVEPMGRGRAKAKQVKVARQLKYNSGGTDLDRLRAELGVGSDQRGGDQDDPYAAYDDDDAAGDDTGDEDDDDEDDEDTWSPKR